MARTPHTRFGADVVVDLDVVGIAPLVTIEGVSVTNRDNRDLIITIVSRLGTHAIRVAKKTNEVRTIVLPTALGDEPELQVGVRVA